MIEYLTLESLVDLAAEAIGSQPLVRDYGLLGSALARPKATVFGADAYDGIWLQASALLHSLVNNDALVDGNKQLGWYATVTFLYLNGHYVDAVTDDAAHDLVIAVATSTIELEKVAELLEAWSQPV